MQQYCVIMTCGAYEDSSLSSLTMFCLVEEDLNPTQVADLWKQQMERCCEVSEGSFTPYDLFLEFFNTPCHEFDYEADEELQLSGWSYRPLANKIDKVVMLMGMDWYLEPDNPYHEHTRKKDGQISSELFEEIKMA